ncbi:MAG: thioredoxin family protein [Candidatus Cryptobacteroides sp.]
MEIRVMGSGCANCKALHATMLEAAKSLGLNEGDVIYDNDIQKVIEMNILRLPAVVINGKVVSQGRKCTVAEAQELIKSQLPRL